MSIEAIVGQIVDSNGLVPIMVTYRILGRKLFSKATGYGEWGLKTESSGVETKDGREYLYDGKKEPKDELAGSTRLQRMVFQGSQGEGRYKILVVIDARDKTQKVVVKVKYVDKDEIRPEWYVKHKARSIASIVANNYRRALDRGGIVEYS